MPPSGKYTPPPEILDPEVLHGYVGDDTAAGNAILGQFVDATQADFAKLALAVTLRDASEIHQLSHRIKSASRMLGCAAMSSAAAKLEEAGRDARWTEISALVKELDYSIASTLAEIRKQLASHEE